MARILIINPNCSEACSAGIAAAVAQFRFAGGPRLDVMTSPDPTQAITALLNAVHHRTVDHHPTTRRP